MQSPRIGELATAVRGGGAGVVDAFWNEVEAHGTPLVEPIDGEPDAMCVTFLWRGDPNEIERVALCGFLVLSEFREHQLTNVDGTDVWSLSLRLPRATRTTYTLSPNDSLVPLDEVTDWRERRKTWTRDPLNPATWDVPANPVRPEFASFRYSLLELPDAPPRRWTLSNPLLPAGRVELRDFYSPELGNERRIWVYTPPAFDPAREWPVVVALDGWEKVHIEAMPTVLDNLVAAGKAPQVVALMVDSGTQAMRDKEMAFHPPFVSFLCEELLPWARREWNVTSHAFETVIAGMSAAGAMAAFAGVTRPDEFGGVLAQSGAFGLPWHDESPGHFLRQCASRDSIGGRFYVEAGLLEVDRIGRAEPLISTSRRFRNILVQKGARVTIAEHACGHDQVVYAETTAEGLHFLFGAAG